MRLLIIADDLTGALDTGVQLSRQNIPTTVLVSAGNIANTEAPACEVLSINLETRHLSPEDAYARTRKVLEKYAISGCAVYIKTDSALRGNTGAALAAASDAAGVPVCFIPALPKMHRITKDAVCYIDGKPLAKSVFRNDPRTPVTESFIPDILRQSAPALTCQAIPFADLPQFAERLQTRSGTCSADACEKDKTTKQSRTVFLFDCESEQQMETIGDTLAAENLYGLTAGCAGFASTFEKHLPFARTDGPSVKQSCPLLLISGSANAVTLSQLAFASARGIPVFSLAEDIYAAYKNGMAADIESLHAYKEALTLLQNGHSVVLATAAAPKELRRITDAGFHETVAQTMASLVQCLLRETSLPALGVFGGDMVAAILKRLSCSMLSVCGEITDGVPVCTFSYNGTDHTLVTKSGGFGKPDVILQMIHFFQT